MNERKKTNLLRAAGVLLAGGCLMAGVALAAGEGTEEDPLITLSYLNQTATPAILDQVDVRTAVYEQELVDKLDQSVRDYAAQMEEVVGQHQDSQHNASYAVVTLKKGQKLNMEVGCEVMLRIGSAKCVAPASPGLIGITSGQSLNNGGALEVNHLYLATISGRAVQAGGDNTKVLVRGSYTVE